MSANESQIGGSHYKTGYEHWDWALDVGIGCLEYAASKYLARLGKKDGEAYSQAVGKTGHYVVKILENAPRLMIRPRMPRRWVSQQTIKFCEVNGLSGEVQTILQLLACWELPSDLREVQRLVQKLATSAEKPVPLEDSNKHAERSNDANA